ncbi:MAG: hypothetical protein Q8P54_00550 [bacterium]|nr:hypothetical protein [bacterium]
MEQTPKQQAVELIKQAQKILLVTGREPNNDQFASIVVLQSVLSKLGKETIAVISDTLPKAKSFLDHSKIAKDITGIQDFIISLNLNNVEIDKLKYHVEDSKLNISVTPKKGNFTSKDATFSYGDYNFDLVIALGVAKLEKMDRLYEQNPTIFDDLHLINIDYHRINENYGSVNLVDTASGSICEILVSLVESLGQDLMDENIATALLTGLMASTNRFTADNTTPKALSIAAQMLAAKAKRGEIVKALYENNHERTKRENRNPAPLANSQQASLEPSIKSVVTQPTKSVGPFKGKIEGSKEIVSNEKIDNTSKNTQ